MAVDMQRRNEAQADLLKAIMARLPAKLAEKQIKLSSEGQYVHKIAIKGNKPDVVNIEGRMKAAVKECAKSIEFSFPDDVDEAVRKINRSRSGSVEGLLSNAYQYSKTGEAADSSTELSGSITRVASVTENGGPKAYGGQSLSRERGIPKHAGHALINPVAREAEPGSSSPSVKKDVESKGSDNGKSHPNGVNPKVENRPVYSLAEQLESFENLSAIEADNSAKLKSMFSNMFRPSPATASPSIPSPTLPSPSHLPQDKSVTPQSSPGTGFSFGRFLNWGSAPQTPKSDASPNTRANPAEISQTVPRLRDVSPARLPENFLSSRLADVGVGGSGHNFYSQTTRLPNVVPSSLNDDEQSIISDLLEAVLTPHNAAAAFLPGAAGGQLELPVQLHDRETHITLKLETTASKGSPASEYNGQEILKGTSGLNNEVSEGITEQGIDRVHITDEKEGENLDNSSESGFGTSRILPEPTTKTAKTTQESKNDIVGGTPELEVETCILTTNSEFTNSKDLTHPNLSTAKKENFMPEQKRVKEASLEAKEGEVSLPGGDSSGPMTEKTSFSPRITSNYTSNYETDTQDSLEPKSPCAQDEQLVIESLDKTSETTQDTERKPEAHSGNVSQREVNIKDPGGSSVAPRSPAATKFSTSSRNDAKSPVEQNFPSQIVHAAPNQEPHFDEVESGPYSDLVKSSQLESKEGSKSENGPDDGISTTSALYSTTEHEEIFPRGLVTSHTHDNVTRGIPPPDGNKNSLDQHDGNLVAEEGPTSHKTLIILISEAESKNAGDFLQPCPTEVPESVKLLKNPLDEIQQPNLSSHEQALPVLEDSGVVAPPDEEKISHNLDDQKLRSLDALPLTSGLQNPVEPGQGAAKVDTELQHDKISESAVNVIPPQYQRNEIPVAAPISPSTTSPTMINGQLGDNTGTDTESTDQKLSSGDDMSEGTDMSEAFQLEMESTIFTKETKVGSESELRSPLQSPGLSLEFDNRSDDYLPLSAIEAAVPQDITGETTVSPVERFHLASFTLGHNLSALEHSEESNDASGNMLHEAVTTANLPHILESKPNNLAEELVPEPAQLANEAKTLALRSEGRHPRYDGANPPSERGSERLSTTENKMKAPEIEFGRDSRQIPEPEPEGLESTAQVMLSDSLAFVQSELDNITFTSDKMLPENPQLQSIPAENAFQTEPPESQLETSEPTFTQELEVSVDSEDDHKIFNKSGDGLLSSPHTPENIRLALVPRTGTMKDPFSGDGSSNGHLLGKIDQKPEFTEHTGPNSTIQIHEDAKSDLERNHLNNVERPSSPTDDTRVPPCDKIQEDLVFLSDGVNNGIPASLNTLTPPAARGLGILIPLGNKATLDLDFPAKSSADLEVSPSEYSPPSMPKDTDQDEDVRSVIEISHSNKVTSKVHNHGTYPTRVVLSSPENSGKLPVNNDDDRDKAIPSGAMSTIHEPNLDSDGIQEATPDTAGIPYEWYDPSDIGPEEPPLLLDITRLRDINLAPPTPRAENGSMLAGSEHCFLSSDQTPPLTPNCGNLEQEGAIPALEVSMEHEASSPLSSIVDPMGSARTEEDNLATSAPILGTDPTNGGQLSLNLAPYADSPVQMFQDKEYKVIPLGPVSFNTPLDNLPESIASPTAAHGCHTKTTPVPSSDQHSVEEFSKTLIEMSKISTDKIATAPATEVVLSPIVRLSPKPFEMAPFAEPSGGGTSNEGIQ
ncbi:hypothetical protein ABW21_db0205883 [Orbilia brochopaga]|nr:hypothetical protein ABW21_db0205883 [Drechslerella brochopaga]